MVKRSRRSAASHYSLLANRSSPYPLGMGFYYGPSAPEPEKEPGGCMEALVLTRAAFATLALPVAILVGAILGIILIFVTFSIHWLLGIAYLGLIATGVGAYARWERRKFPGEPRP